MMKLTRRKFIKYTAGGISAVILAGKFSGCAGKKEKLLFFSDRQFKVIEKLMSGIIPEGDIPGAESAGSAWYLDKFLGAFNVDPPLIYAGGPYSGRSGGEANFKNFIPLTRIEELTWRIIIEGSKGISEREFNGPVKGLQEVYTEGIHSVENLSSELYKKDVLSLNDNDVAGLLDSLKVRNPEFFRTLLIHTYEGTYSAPEYGGNRDLSGWKAIDYPGDVQPRGYNQKEMEELDDPNAPPELTREILNEFLLEFLKQGGGKL
jgi:hypothetical protein